MYILSMLSVKSGIDAALLSCYIGGVYDLKFHSNII